MEDEVIVGTVPVVGQPTAENRVERAMLDTQGSNFAPYTLQELEQRNEITTPLDTPLLTMLLAKSPRRVYNDMFEWTETPLNSNLASGKYGGYDTSVIDETTPAPATKANWIMSVGQIARISGRVKALAGGGNVETDSSKIEVETKYANLRRMVEYFLWRGNHTTSADETNGLSTLVTTAVDNSVAAVAAPLQEENLEIAIVQMIDEGLEPDAIFANPLHAQRIARFNKARVMFDDVNKITNGLGQKAFRYSTAFGYVLEVFPVRSVYIPTNKIYVIDTKKVSLVYTSESSAVFQDVDLAEANDGKAKLFKCYFALQIKQQAKHRVITNVTTALQ